jgi:hypothetical protein
MRRCPEAASSGRGGVRHIYGHYGQARGCPRSLRGALATKQSSAFFLVLDCFVEPVIGRAFARPVGSQCRRDTAPRSRDAMRPSCENHPPKKQRAQATLKDRGRREDRVRAAPAVSCAVFAQSKSAHEHTGSAVNNRPSLRNGFTAYSVLSPATNSSCHRHRRIEWCGETRLGSQRLRRLDTSNGCQDHTALPSATAPFVLRTG